MALLVSVEMFFIFNSSGARSLMAAISELVWIFRLLRMEVLAATLFLEVGKTRDTITPS